MPVDYRKRGITIMRNLIVLMLLAHAGAASAHHAFAADYEPGNEGIIEGTITEAVSYTHLTLPTNREV